MARLPVFASRSQSRHRVVDLGPVRRGDPPRGPRCRGRPPAPCARTIPADHGQDPAPPTRDPGRSATAASFRAGHGSVCGRGPRPHRDPPSRAAIRCDRPADVRPVPRRDRSPGASRSSMEHVHPGAGAGHHRPGACRRADRDRDGQSICGRPVGGDASPVRGGGPRRPRQDDHPAPGHPFGGERRRGERRRGERRRGDHPAGTGQKALLRRQVPPVLSGPAHDRLPRGAPVRLSRSRVPRDGRRDLPTNRCRGVGRRPRAASEDDRRRGLAWRGAPRRGHPAALGGRDCAQPVGLWARIDDE